MCEENVEVCSFSVLGESPQDMKYKGETTLGQKITRIGKNYLFMVGVYVHMIVEYETLLFLPRMLV